MMKTISMCLSAMIIVFVAFAQSTYAAARSVSLSVSQPKKTENREKDDDRSYSGFSYSRNVVTKSSSWYYSGKVGCSVPKDSSTTITIEAFFVTRGLEKGAKEKIAGEMVIGSFDFGGDNPRTQAFEFDSPAFEETETKRSYSGYYGGSSVNEHSGTRYLGVILRAVEDGKILKVISMPSNQKWIKAGKEDMVTFDEKKARKAAKSSNEHRLPRNGHNASDVAAGGSHRGKVAAKTPESDAQVFTRIEGTGQSTPPGWMDDFYAAQEIARNENKWIFVVFSGSDWCGWCKKLADTVLKKAKFQNAAKKSYVLVFIDSPHDTSLLSEKCRNQNKQIKRMLGAGGGVPEVDIVTANGEKLANLGGCSHIENGVDSYLAYFQNVDKGLRIVQDAKASLKGKDRSSPEAIKTMHNAMMQIDEEIMIRHFRNEAGSIVRADASYAKFYPYFSVVQPLEAEVDQLISKLSRAANALLQKDGIEYTYQEFKKRQRTVFEDEDYAGKFNAILQKVNVAEKSLKPGSGAHKLLGNLRVRIYEQINNK